VVVAVRERRRWAVALDLVFRLVLFAGLGWLLHDDPHPFWWARSWPGAVLGVTVVSLAVGGVGHLVRLLIRRRRARAG
jgi:hypothetical protein